jgi:hypothetical protein
MAGFVVGTLSTSVGFETKSVIAALSWHFTYYFTSRQDQGKVLSGTPSFYYTWKQYGEIPDTLIDRSKQELQSYFKELFPQCDVNVTKQAIDGSPNHYTLNFGVRVLYNGLYYDLAQSVYVDGERYKVLDQRRLG